MYATDSGTSVGTRLFVQQGGDGVVQDFAGSVFLTAGYIFVYWPNGKQIWIINVAKRPIHQIYGRNNLGTLNILTHGNLYSMTPSSFTARIVKSNINGFSVEKHLENRIISTEMHPAPVQFLVPLPRACKR